MAKLLADENVPLRLVKALRKLGHDVLRVQDPELAVQGTPDSDLLHLATSLGRAVLTENAWDFVRLHRASNAHAGIVTFTRDADIAALASRVHAEVPESGELTGLLIRVRRPAN